MKHNPLAPLILKFDCVRFYVPDLESGLAFYCDRLGHELIWRTDEMVGLRMPDTDAEIVLHTDPQEPEIDFKVQSADDAAARIEEAGGKVVVPPFDIQIGRCAVVQDPWGNEFVLLDASKGLLITDEEGNVIGNTEP
ncbi:MAG: VOC family protein [Anaerolineae bacterium]|nr:VOC family protein [Anaerolineae bacterium]